MAGRITTVFDLKGRTLIPGIVETHAHIYGGALNYAARFGLQYPPDGVTFISAQADRDLEKTQAIMRDAIRDTVKTVDPGDWIVLNMRSHPDAPRELSTWGMTRRLTNRQTLDLIGSQLHDLVALDRDRLVDVAHIG